MSCRVVLHRPTSQQLLGCAHVEREFCKTAVSELFQRGKKSNLVYLRQADDMQLCSSWDGIIQSRNTDESVKECVQCFFCFPCRISCCQNASIPFMICAKNFTRATLVQPPWKTRLSRPWQNVSFCCSFCNRIDSSFLGFVLVIVMGFVLLN